MRASAINDNVISIDSLTINRKQLVNINENIAKAWEIIGASWPLKNMVASNPLSGLIDLPFEEALTNGAYYFQKKTLPVEMEKINIETIKWCQVFFDEGQSTISMPDREIGLYQSWKYLIRFDSRLHHNNANVISWIKNLPDKSEDAVTQCLNELGIPNEKHYLFLKLLLTTLPGWASYVKYHSNWNPGVDNKLKRNIKSDYLAIRIVITSLLWRNAAKLLESYTESLDNAFNAYLDSIINNEKLYQHKLLEKISLNHKINRNSQSGKSKAQIIFCIDVRSEPIRRQLESYGRYETFGFAGFFGLPIIIKNELIDKEYQSCPVIVEPKHTVSEGLHCSKRKINMLKRNKNYINTIKSVYQSLKYNFTTPLNLVEMLGSWSGLLMAFKTLLPRQYINFKKTIIPYQYTSNVTHPHSDHIVNAIPFIDQCLYAENALRMIGLVDHFSKVIVLCGHASETVNNAYASALNCGACGANAGGSNAKLLAAILNSEAIRRYLKAQEIEIPSDTIFIAAEHNTVTDDIKLFYVVNTNNEINDIISQLQNDINAAKKITAIYRYNNLEFHRNHYSPDQINHRLEKKSNDWSETRPEWGLSTNASFIIAPRSITKEIDLEGRAFLHSYNYHIDSDGSLLSAILSGPLTVAQWINSQYFFSSLDNIAYGSGSKITHNIVGKFGVMQGNSSDLMHGLPLQSVNIDNEIRYHQPIRLICVIYAPKELVSNTISNNAYTLKLVKNGWLNLFCIDPNNGCALQLNRDLSWVNDIIET